MTLLTDQCYNVQVIDDTALLVPAYNEGQVIHEHLAAACRAFRWVVCVDDGSSDDTAIHAGSAGAIVLRHPVNLGQGAALQTAIEYALRLPVIWFCTFDADGQHRLDDVIAMREVAQTLDVDIVLGSRFLGQTTNMPTVKRWLLKAAVRFTDWTSGVKLTDAHNGLRLFNRHVAQTIDLQENGFNHASEFIDKIKTNGYTFAEAPVTIDYSDYSKAKGQSMLNAINLATDTLITKVVRK